VALCCACCRGRPRFRYVASRQAHRNAPARIGWAGPENSPGVDVVEDHALEVSAGEACLIEEYVVAVVRQILGDGQCTGNIGAVVAEEDRLLDTCHGGASAERDDSKSILLVGSTSYESQALREVMPTVKKHAAAPLRCGKQPAFSNQWMHFVGCWSPDISSTNYDTREEPPEKVFRKSGKQEQGLKPGRISNHGWHTKRTHG